MSQIRILIDMNLSPNWVEAFIAHGWPALHWASIGDPSARDREIMDWARVNDYIIFTHDLDFGTILALTHQYGPSVFQIRGQDVLPNHLLPIVLATLKQHEQDLASAAIVVVDEFKSRVRVLPI
ncbi:MAG: DUF5615 family PIN-like protein [Planctomycetota bacterium]